MALAENEEVLKRIGWPNMAADMGLPEGANAVTISRYTGGDVVTSVFGRRAEEMLPYLADALVKQSGWELVFTVGMATGAYRPLLVLSPILAETIAGSGFSKDRLRGWLYEHARMPAWKFERYISGWTNLVPGHRSLTELAALGKAPAAFAESDDPERMVPIVGEPDDFGIAVAGDPLRTNAYVFAHNGILGYPVSREIELPADWDARLAAAG